MMQIPLYKYGDSVGPRRQAKLDPIHGYRLVADDGKILTNGIHLAECVDILVDELDGWSEINTPEDYEE